MDPKKVYKVIFEQPLSHVGTASSRYSNIYFIVTTHAVRTANEKKKLTPNNEFTLC